MAKKTISLKIDTRTIEHMEMAIKKNRDKAIFEVSQAEFIRTAIETLAQIILQDKEMPVEVTK